MKQKLLIPFLLFLGGCFTIMIPPHIYEPSILKKSSADVSYCIDEKLKNIELILDGKMKEESNFAQSLTVSLQKTMEQIFYSPKEVNSFEDVKTKYFILFEKELSDLKSVFVGDLIYRDYEYTLKVKVTIYKDKKKIDEIIAMGYAYQGYRGFMTNLTSSECIKLACEKALKDVIKNIGDYLMNYKFES